MNSVGATASAHHDAHPSWVILIHWLTVVLLLLATAAVLSMDLTDDRGLRKTLMSVHRAAGLMVLAVTLLRLVVSPWVVHRTSGASRTALRIAALLSHVTLYAVLIVNPLIGWALTSARGQVAYFLGVIPLPALLAKNRDLADTLESLHTAVAIVLLVVIALHSCAALWHHFVRRDDVLKRMLALRRDDRMRFAVARKQAEKPF